MRRSQWFRTGVKYNVKDHGIQDSRRRTNTVTVFVNLDTAAWMLRSSHRLVVGVITARHQPTALTAAFRLLLRTSRSLADVSFSNVHSISYGQILARATSRNRLIGVGT